MSLYWRWLPILLALLLMSEQAMAAWLSQVRARPKTLRSDGSAGSKGPVTIDFQLARAATVWLDIRDESEQVIYSSAPGRALEPGSHALTWHGNTRAGNAAPAGVYTYILRAQDARGATDRFDPSADTWGLPIRVRDVDYDRTAGVIRYLLPHAGRVRVRVGIKDGPLLHTLRLWEPQEAGPKHMVWDGRDASGTMWLAGNPKSYILINAYTLADNSIIVSGPSAASPPPAAITTLRRPVASRTPNGEERYYHALHRPWMRMPLTAYIHLPEAQETSSGYQLAPGSTRIVIDAPSASRAYLMASRFEVILFVDGVFLIEDEEGYLPYTYLWDTSALRSGEHLLTVNLISYEDHIAVKTVRIRIDEDTDGNAMKPAQ